MLKSKDGVYLTPRQKDVLSLSAKGKSYKQIASDLRIDEDTVRCHLTNIRLKLNVNNTSGAVAFALSKGMIVYQ